MRVFDLEFERAGIAVDICRAENKGVIAPGLELILDDSVAIAWDGKSDGIAFSGNPGECSDALGPVGQGWFGGCHCISMERTMIVFLVICEGRRSFLDVLMK